MGENRCISCGQVIPEGSMSCLPCEDGRTNLRNLNVVETVVGINTVDKVKEFCSLCSKCPEDVLVYSGRYIISAKSLMGLFSLNLTKPLKVEFYGSIPDEVKEGMKKFIVN